MSVRNLQNIGLLLVAAACGNNDQQKIAGPAAISVEVQRVQAAPISYYDEYPAIVKALNEVELRPQVSGYITGIHFVEGTHVQKGQRLYSIDQQQSEATYQQAMANLQVQEANFMKARQDVERYRELNKRDAVAKQQVDYAEAAFEAARQQVEAAKASVKSVQTNVRYSTIVAPFPGTIGISSVRLGASVSPGQTLLNTISSDDPMGVDITVDQREIFRFTTIKNRPSAKGDSTFRFLLGGQLYRFSGKISIIDRAVDPQTGTIKMRLIFPNPDHVLRSGMSGTLNVLSSADRALLIPYKSISEQLGEFFVYVADSGRVSQRRVVLGHQIGKDIVISTGLKENETIVTGGIQNLREGSAITVASSQKSGDQ